MNKMMKLALVGMTVIGSACAPQATEDAAAPEVKPQEVVQMSERLDQRQILPLNQMQRQHVLEEMRGLLIATQGVIKGLAENDMQSVQEAAIAVSLQAQGTIENKQNMKRLRMGQVLPPEFRKLGKSAHIAFGEMAQMAADGASAKDIQLKLADTMDACVACHMTYQIPNP